MDGEEDTLRDEYAREATIAGWAASGDFDRVRATFDDAPLLVRYTIIRLLAKAPPSTETLHFLLRVSVDADVDVRRNAIDALRHYVTPEVLQRLTDALADPDDHIKNSAQFALRSFADLAPIEQIVPLLGIEHAEGFSASYTAAETLLAYPHRERVPLAPLLWRIMHPDWERRHMFTNELSAMEQDLLAQPQVLADACEATHMAALLIVRSMGDRAPRAAIFAALDHWLPPLRALAVTVCGECCHPLPGGKPLALLADLNTRVRLAAARVLVQSRHPVWFAAACALLDDEDTTVQEGILHLVGPLLPTASLLPYLDVKSPMNGKKSQEKLLRELVPRPDTPTYVLDRVAKERYWWDLRRDALHQLAHRPDASIPAIEAALDDRTKEVRDAAQQALHLLRGDPPAAASTSDEPPDDEMDESLPEPTEMTPDQVIDYLGYIEPTIWQPGIAAVQAQRETFPLEPLLALLSEKYPHIRIHALKALAEIGPRVPTQPLLDALYDSSEVYEDIRYPYEAAIEALRRTHPEALSAFEDEAVAHLLGAPAGPLLSPLAEMFACQVIGSMYDPTPEALERVVILLEHPNWRLRLAAVQSVIALIDTSGWMNRERPYPWRHFPTDIEPRLTALAADPSLPSHVRKRAQYAISCLPENERRRPTDA